MLRASIVFYFSCKKEDVRIYSVCILSSLQKSPETGILLAVTQTRVERMGQWARGEEWHFPEYAY